MLTIRPPTPDDVEVLIAGRDREFHRFLGEGDPEPSPTACIVADGVVVGWVDYDHERDWLAPDEVNVGYSVLAAHRGRGYATRAVRLLLEHLADDTAWRVATLLIHPDNERSLALARRAGFEQVGNLDGNPYWKRLVDAAAADLGPWAPLDVESVQRLLSAAPIRWWVGGGLALELHAGRSWRAHGDTDVGMLRQEARRMHDLLAGWDLHVAAAGELTAWHGEPLDRDRQQNNVWCRPSPTEPWALDLTVGEGTDSEWVYRRDPTLRVPWSAAVLRTTDGLPYLAPELQLLFKSKNPRPKDDLDAAEVIPGLDGDRRQRLGELLDAHHPWQRLLRQAPPDFRQVLK